MKRCSISIVIRKISIKTIKRYNFTLTTVQNLNCHLMELSRKSNEKMDEKPFENSNSFTNERSWWWHCVGPLAAFRDMMREEGKCFPRSPLCWLRSLCWRMSAGALLFSHLRRPPPAHFYSSSPREWLHYASPSPRWSGQAFQGLRPPPWGCPPWRGPLSRKMGYRQTPWGPTLVPCAVIWEPDEEAPDSGGFSSELTGGLHC